jgi:hypothetical protein
MSLAEAGEIFGYWEDSPPAHLMLQAIARMLGWVPRPAQAGPPQIADIAAAALPGLAVARSGEPGMPAPFDVDALRAQNRARAIAIARRNGSTAGG